MEGGECTKKGRAASVTAAVACHACTRAPSFAHRHCRAPPRPLACVLLILDPRPSILLLACEHACCSSYNPTERRSAVSLPARASLPGSTRFCSHHPVVCPPPWCVRLCSLAAPEGTGRHRPFRRGRTARSGLSPPTPDGPDHEHIARQQPIWHHAVPDTAPPSLHTAASHTPQCIHIALQVCPSNPGTRRTLQLLHCTAIPEPLPPPHGNAP